MKKTARVIVTLACNRKCPGCCNETIGKVASIGDISVLSDYEEVVITGGEPMLNPDSLLRFILNQLDGITVTLHAEATDDDIRNLKYMSYNLYGEDLDMRLFIDRRVYEKYDLSNICLKTWDVVRKLEWKEKCDPADNEDLLLFHLF